MQIHYSDDHLAWKDTVVDFCERTVRPSLKGLDLTRPPTREEINALLNKFIGKGIVDGYPLREDGSPDYIAFAILIEELARVHHLAGFMTMQRLHVPRLFREMFDKEQQKNFNHLFFSDRTIIAACFSEPGAGSDSAGTRTTAKRSDNGNWVINGRKIWVSEGSHADALIVFVRVDKEIEPSGYGIFLVERGGGYEATPIKMMGLQAHEMCEVAFDNVVVPDINRVRGNAQAAVLGTIGRARPYMGVMATGYAQAALDMAVSYAKTHEQFGRPIGGFQLVQKLLADMAMGVASSRLMYYQALNTLMRKGEKASRVEASMAKAYCTETAWRVCSKGMEVHGAMGLTFECGIERLFRDARMLMVPDGTTQIHELVIGRALTGMSAIN